jgi:biopolymer transport protein ExbB/TolQ
VGEGLGLFLKDWGPQSLLSAYVIAQLLGYIESWRSVNKKLELIKQQKDEALERERYQRSANEKLQATVDLQARQLDDLMEQGRTVIAILSSIASAASAPDSGRHRDAV